jgi:hypothetical protein
MPGTFDGFRKQTLMCRADATDAPGQNLSAFGYKMTQEFSVLEINICNFFRAKLAYSFAPNTKPSLTWHSSQPFYRSTVEGSGVFRSDPC